MAASPCHLDEENCLWTWWHYSVIIKIIIIITINIIIIIIIIIITNELIRVTLSQLRLLQGHCTNTLSPVTRQEMISEKKCLFKLLPKLSEWRCSSDARWQSHEKCSWYRKRSISQRWTMRRRYNQCHGISGAKTSSSIHITSRL